MRRIHGIAVGVLLIGFPLVGFAQSTPESALCPAHLMVVSQSRYSLEQTLARLIVAQEQLQAKVKELEEKLEKAKDGRERGEVLREGQ